jgi:cell pole-organizing protein PopZ
MRRAGKKASEAMTAYPSIISEAKAAEQRAHEPSMEEILASIRRIISDDQALPLSSNPQATPRDERLPPLREPEMDRKRAAAAPRTSADFSGSFVSPPPSRPARPDAQKPTADVREFSARPSAPAPRLVSRDEPPLVSEQTDMAVTSSFQVLGVARSMPTSQTVDAMAREMLRPMLKEWLDKHLPGIVERAVRAEIERVVNRGG